MAYKYIPGAVAALLLLSSCSTVQSVKNGVSGAAKSVTGLFSGDEERAERAASPEKYLSMRSDAPYNPENPYAGGSSRGAAVQAVNEVKSQADMIESDALNDAFAPLYVRYGLRTEILDAHAALLLERGRYLDVVNLIEGAWTQGGGMTPELLNSAGMASFARGERGDAFRFFREALSLNPSDVKTVNNIAVLYLAEGRPAEALDILSALPLRTVSGSENAERVAFNKALANAMTGNMPEAERLLRMVMDDAQVNANMAYFLRLRNNPDASVFFLNRSMGLGGGTAGGMSLDAKRPPAAAFAGAPKTETPGGYMPAYAEPTDGARGYRPAAAPANGYGAPYAAPGYRAPAAPAAAPYGGGNMFYAPPASPQQPPAPVTEIYEPASLGTETVTHYRQKAQQRGARTFFSSLDAAGAAPARDMAAADPMLRPKAGFAPPPPVYADESPEYVPPGYEEPNSEGYDENGGTAEQAGDTLPSGYAYEAPPAYEGGGYDDAAYPAQESSALPELPEYDDTAGLYAEPAEQAAPVYRGPDAAYRGPDSAGAPSAAGPDWSSHDMQQNLTENYADPLLENPNMRVGVTPEGRRYYYVEESAADESYADGY